MFESLTCRKINLGGFSYSRTVDDKRVFIFKFGAILLIGICVFYVFMHLVLIILMFHFDPKALLLIASIEHILEIIWNGDRQCV